MLRTNGGASDTDGTIDNTLVDAACYGSGQTYIDADNSGTQNGHDPYIFTSGTCMSDISSGSYRRSSGTTACL